MPADESDRSRPRLHENSNLLGFWVSLYPSQAASKPIHEDLTFAVVRRFAQTVICVTAQSNNRHSPIDGSPLAISSDFEKISSRSREMFLDDRMADAKR
jgi:hypothetical protein